MRVPRRPDGQIQPWSLGHAAQTSDGTVHSTLMVSKEWTDAGFRLTHVDITDGVMLSLTFTMIDPDDDENDDDTDDDEEQTDE